MVLSVFGGVSLPDATIFKRNQNSGSATAKFCHSQGSKQWFIKKQLLS